jgi:3-oxoadipate enol-lactonase
VSGATDLVVARDGFALRGEIRGEGPTVLALHGLTATRRYVFHGSHTVARAGYRVVGYDARGHGESDPSPDPAAYRYADYADDAMAVLDAIAADRAVLVGHSMGAHTAVRVALLHPERVAALVLGGPAHLGRPSHNLARWDALAEGLETGGPEGMFAAFGDLNVPPEWVDNVRAVIIQRLSRHRHREAVAAALRATPRSAAFDGMDALAGVSAPALVVGSHDEIDPDHPLAVAQEYARRIPDARLIVEDPGQAPLTWRGGALSRAILDFLAA